jgi:hypothetical protein
MRSGFAGDGIEIAARSMTADLAMFSLGGWIDKLADYLYKIYQQLRIRFGSGWNRAARSSGWGNLLDSSQFSSLLLENKTFLAIFG